MDTMTIEILEDGTIKVDSSKISPQQHMSAEALLRNLATAAGGKQQRRHKAGVLGAAAHALAHALNRAHQH